MPQTRLGPRTPSLLLAIAALALAGCAEEQLRPAPAPAVKAVAKTAPAARAPAGHASRAAVEEALSAGPPWLLRRVQREEVLNKSGRFIGWRITGLPEAWGDIDLRPGDVVSRVNDKALETPDEAWDAWKATGRAREIRVRIERGGVSREVVIPIDGSPSASVVRALESDTPPPRQPTTGKPKSVTSIGTDEHSAETGEYESY